MYPGIPEYFSPRGRGMYPYLTGSASWYLLTMLTEVYGVRGELGDLVLAPKLLASQFGADGKTVVETLFAGKKLRVTYQNLQGLDYGQYSIGRVLVNGLKIASETVPGGVKIKRAAIESLAENVEIVAAVISKEPPSGD
jgi:cellobiose phosphorylase